MATISGPRTANPRASTETDRRHLLSESVAPSETSSLYSYQDGDRTPRAQSPTRFTSPQPLRRDTLTDPTPRPYKGFPSEAAYLAALHEWAEEKKYITPNTQLFGFYGHTTMSDYASKPRPQMSMDLKKKWRERKARKEEQKLAVQERRNTVA